MDNPKWGVIDLETSVRGTNDWPANPYHKDNIIVAGGSTWHDTSVTGNGINYLDKWTSVPTYGSKNNASGLIGHNLQFDLAYLFRYQCKVNSKPIREEIPNMMVWDTAIAEYVLTGQRAKFPSLDVVSTMYGGTLKDSKIKDYWAGGMMTEDIPAGELTEYLKADVENTRIVFNRQLEVADKQGQLDLILSLSRAAVGFTEIQHNGMAIDTFALHKSQLEYQIKRDRLLTNVISDLLIRVPCAMPSSNKDLSLYFFGGTYSNTTRVPDGSYKNGKPKMKTAVHATTVDALIDGNTWSKPTKVAGVFTVDEEVLTAIAVSGLAPVANVAKGVLTLRGYNKILDTYIGGISENVLRNTLDTRVHATYNLTATDTGRTSSSDPNMQNIPSGDDDTIKEFFVSRWGDDGCLIEVDFKQLEVIALAFITQCPQLLSDIRSGVDIHDKMALELYGRGYTKEQRRVVKTINFGLIYGGSANSLARQAGVDRKFTEKAIKAFYDRYQGVRTWHDQLEKCASLEAKLTTERTPAGLQVHEWTTTLPTGRRYTYKTEDNKYQSGRTRWPITKMKNYPVQGLATGDIVPIMVGEMFSALMRSKFRDDCLMINQVHDSILFDCKKNIRAQCVTMIREVLESAPEVVERIFGFKFDLPLKVSVSTGPNWNDLEET